MIYYHGDKRCPSSRGIGFTNATAERILTHFETSLENSERPESRKGERSKRRQRPINNVHFPPRPSEPDGQGGKLFDIKKKCHTKANGKQNIPRTE